MLILLIGCLLGMVASYLLFTRLICNDLAKLQEQGQVLPPAVLLAMPPAETSRKPKR